MTRKRKNRSLAEGYRDYLRRGKTARMRALPWPARKVLLILSWFRRKIAVSRLAKQAYVRNERVAVYTSFFGSYDILREPLTLPDNVDYFVMTDQEVPSGSAWKKIDISSLVPAYCLGDPVLLNRWCKMHPHLLLKDYQYSVYVDSNIWVFSDLTPLTAGLDSFPVAMFSHKRRNCVYDEIRACLKQGKGTKESLDAHEKLIRSHGVPRNWGLLEASVIARKHLDPECVDLMESWWEAFTKNSRRDQISLIDCLWLKGIEPSVIGTLGSNLQKSDLFIQLHHKGDPKSEGEPTNLQELINCIGL